MNDSSNDLDTTQFFRSFPHFKEKGFLFSFVRLDEAGTCIASSNKQFSAIFNAYVFICFIKAERFTLQKEIHSYHTRNSFISFASLSN